jgi:phosphatidylglycerol:prolipoprotein diacylglycerol transferase
LLGAISYNPIVRVHLGPLSISPHGVGIAVGFLIAARFMLPRSRSKGMPDDDIYPLFTRAAIGAIVGARLAYVVNHYADYSSVIDVFEVWKGGISLIGGFFGAILLALPKIRSTRLSFWKVMDAAAPAMALGVTIGRIGDLIVGDHLGKRTSFFLGFRCPGLNVQTASPCAPTAFSPRTPGAVVHQTALYDMILAGILLLILLAFEKREHFHGFMVLVFATGYGCARVLEDFLRDDLRRFGLTGSQWAAIATVLLSLFTLLVLRRTPKWGRWDEGPPGEPPPPTLDGEADHPSPEDTPATVDGDAIGDQPSVETEESL